MYYIEETDTEVIEYEVEIDKEKLLKLREKIIDECSAIEHKKINQVEGLLEPSFFEGRDIRNYKERRIGRKEYFYAPDKDIYEIEYDEYHHTDIVRYIDYLLNGAPLGISLLKDYSSSCKPITLLKNSELEEKNTIKKELKKPLKEMKISSLKQSINSLELLKEEIELNKNQVSDKIYYDAVMKCITLTEVDRLKKDDIKRIEEFQGITYTKKK